MHLIKEFTLDFIFQERRGTSGVLNLFTLTTNAVRQSTMQITKAALLFKLATASFLNNSSSLKKKLP